MHIVSIQTSEIWAQRNIELSHQQPFEKVFGKTAAMLTMANVTVESLQQIFINEQFWVPMFVLKSKLYCQYP